MEKYFLELLGCLRALSFGYQQIHWLSKSPAQFYQDHLLAERLYNGVEEEIDPVAEKAMGVTQNPDSIDLMKAIKIAQVKLESFKPNFAVMLEMEKNFIAYCAKYEKDSKSTLGMRNMFADMSDRAEGRVYLLQQRLG